MTEEELQKIEKVINGEEWPDELWVMETLHELVFEVRRLRYVLLNLPTGGMSPVEFRALVRSHLEK